MPKLPLHIKILIGLAAGSAFAVAGSFLGLSVFTIQYIDPFGVIFIRLLKLIAVPLVLFSIIKGISGMESVKQLGRLGAKTILFYFGTTLFAVSTGLFLVNVIKPGNKIDNTQRLENRLQYEAWLEENPQVERLDSLCYSCKVERTINSEVGKIQDDVLLQRKIEAAKLTQERNPLDFLVDMVPENIFFSLNDNTLMLQVIFFAIFFGLTLLFLPHETVKPLKNLISAFDAVFIKMVGIVMAGAPFFVFALMAGTLAKMAGDNPAQVIEIFIGLGWYALTVLLGLGFLLFGVYPLILATLVKKVSYTGFFKAMAPAQLLAFSSSSSAATLPITLNCVENRLKVPSKISTFVLPIGATINMDGTSLYQAVAVVFLAQMHMVELDLAHQAIIVLTATLASIGSAAVPSAGIVMLMVVLESVGLNAAWVAIIFPVDRILDMCRTVVNVTGDATVSTFVAKSEGVL
ncbi:MAG: dicarboxylate/amino acid:cation symporter [Luteibaculaceae bacterium]